MTKLKYSGPDCMVATAPNLLSKGEREYVLVVHDESSFF